MWGFWDSRFSDAASRRTEDSPESIPPHGGVAPRARDIPHPLAVHRYSSPPVSRLFSDEKVCFFEKIKYFEGEASRFPRKIRLFYACLYKVINGKELLEKKIPLHFIIMQHAET